MFSPAIPQHTPGPFCGACNPTPCRVVGCAGHVHHVQADGEKRCDACKRRS